MDRVAGVPRARRRHRDGHIPRGVRHAGGVLPEGGDGAGGGQPRHSDRVGNVGVSAPTADRQTQAAPVLESGIAT